MRVLIVHNAYQQAGGEDSVVANEAALLASSGFQLSRLTVDNNGIGGAGARVRAALAATYSLRGRRLVAEAIAEHRPDVLHVHNFFPLISPGLFDAAEAAGVPSVWTLHNFRLACAGGLLFRDGRPCERCVAGSPLPALLHRCYRGSLVGSAAVAASIGVHRARGTWRRKVTRFIALNHFCRDRFIAAGLPAERIVVKPNFAPDPGVLDSPRSGALFVGRLSAEKGVRTLVGAWREVGDPLTIIGEGPLREELEAIAPTNVRFAGKLPPDEVASHLSQAALLVVPSLSYENFPMVIAEAFGAGTPVLASDLGSMRAIVEPGITGRLFEPGNAGALAAAARDCLARPEALRRMGAAARAHYLDRLSPDRCVAALRAIYRDAIEDQAMAA